MPLKEYITYISQEKRAHHVTEGDGGALVLFRRKREEQRESLGQTFWEFPLERQGKAG